MNSNIAAVMGEVDKAIKKRNVTSDVKNSLRTNIDDVANDFINILYKCVEKKKDDIAPREHEFRVVAQVGNIEYKGLDAACEINIDHSVQTTSWLPELYDYSLDLVRLMNNGYSAKNVLYIWDDQGHLIDRSRQWYPGAHFIEEAVRIFNEKYVGIAEADYDRNIYG